MRSTYLAVAATGLGLLVTSGTARAENNVRLAITDYSPTLTGGLSGAAVNQTLQLDDTNDAENELIWRRGWGGGWNRGGWGWRGGWAGSRGWGGWGWGGRGWGWGSPWVARNWGWGWGSPWVARNWGWGGWGWNGWGGWPVTTYYYSPPLYYYYPSYSYYCPIVLDSTNAGYGATLGINPQQPAANVAPAPANQNNNHFGTYPYNGGPSNPVPMPQGAMPDNTRPAPTPSNLPQPPRKTVPLDGIPISVPAPVTTAPVKYTYPAYGETQHTRPAFAEDRPTLIRR